MLDNNQTQLQASHTHIGASTTLRKILDRRVRITLSTRIRLVRITSKLRKEEARVVAALKEKIPICSFGIVPDNNPPMNWMIEKKA
jgi:hypothetical protein